LKGLWAICPVHALVGSISSIALSTRFWMISRRWRSSDCGRTTS